MADGIHWNDAAFASLAKSAPVKAAVSKATKQICARANSAAYGHKGAIRLPTSKGGKAVPVSRIAKPPYAAKVKTLSNTAFGVVCTATPVGGADQSQFHSLNRATH